MLFSIWVLSHDCRFVTFFEAVNTFVGSRGVNTRPTSVSPPITFTSTGRLKISFGLEKSHIYTYARVYLQTET